MQSAPPALAGERLTLQSSAGLLNLYVSGAGAPLLLIHSVNAAASAAEVNPLKAHYEETGRQVYCLDLPGFGLSERSDRRYDPRLMTDAIHAARDAIRARTSLPVDALALSLSCEFLARAAAERPEAFRTVALVSPTGFSRRGDWRGPPGSTRGKPWLYKTLRGPGWGSWLYRQLTRPRVIRYFLRRTWGSRDIDEWLWQYDIRQSKLPGAEYAPLWFLSAGLFSADIHTIYSALTMPVWVAHGTRGDFTDYRQLGIVAGKPNWRVTVFETGALPHFEEREKFCRIYDELLGA